MPLQVLHSFPETAAKLREIIAPRGSGDAMVTDDHDDDKVEPPKRFVLVKLHGKVWAVPLALWQQLARDPDERVVGVCSVLYD